MDRLTKKRLRIVVDAALVTMLAILFSWALASSVQKEVHRMHAACIKDNGKESNNCRGDD
jgi:hypothetical protein